MESKLKKAGKHLKRIAKAMIPDLTPQNSKTINKRNSSFTAVPNSPASTSTSNTPQPTPPPTPVIAAKHQIRAVTPEKPRANGAREVWSGEDAAIRAAGGMHCQEWLKGRFEEPVGEMMGKEPLTCVSESGTVVRKV